MPSLRKAVTLAAGRGTRMKSLTDDCPKPMLPLKGRPMLAHQIERMEQAGIEDVLVIVGYRADVVKNYFAAHPPANARLTYCHQEPQNGTGSAALLAKNWAGGDPILMTFGDILVAPEIYKGIMERMSGAGAVLAVKYVDDPYQGAAVYTEGNRITRIVEKPPQGTSTSHWMNAGIYGFTSTVFDELERIPLSPRGEYELTDAIHQMLHAGVPFGWIEIEGFWRDVGRPEDLPAAEEQVE